MTHVTHQILLNSLATNKIALEKCVRNNDVSLWRKYSQIWQKWVKNFPCNWIILNHAFKIAGLLDPSGYSNNKNIKLTVIMMIFVNTQYYNYQISVMYFRLNNNQIYRYSFPNHNNFTTQNYKSNSLSISYLFLLAN